MKSYVAEVKGFIARGRVRRRKKGKFKMKVHPTILLKTNIEKMSVWGWATMSMKIRYLFHYSHDIYEKKGLSSSRRSKTDMGGCANDRCRFVPLSPLSIQWRARQACLGAAPLRVGGLTTTHMDVVTHIAANG